MELNTKQELYDYLNNFDFQSLQETKLSSVYFLVEYSNHIAPIYFSRFENVWFESPCTLWIYSLGKDEAENFLKEYYMEEDWDEGRKYLKTMYRNGKHYEIDCFQVSPFLPDQIKILDVFTESKCLDWLLAKEY